MTPITFPCQGKPAWLRAEIERLQKINEVLLSRSTYKEWCENKARLEQLQAWVNDLQSGMYVNCVYCGHRYGPLDAPTPVSMADTLASHIEKCPAHPLREAFAQIERLKAVVAQVRKTQASWEEEMAQKDAEIERLKALLARAALALDNGDLAILDEMREGSK